MTQVFGNLIENAMKYGKSGGRVRVSARRAGQEFEEVEFVVEDFGSGIAYEHLSRIFERFYRVDKARSRDSGGTGLGLAIVKHIVQAHGGRIWAESELGSGAAFHFTLPVVQRDPAQREPVQREVSPAQLNNPAVDAQREDPVKNSPIPQDILRSVSFTPEDPSLIQEPVTLGADNNGSGSSKGN
jgi:hypothetical protein